MSAPSLTLGDDADWLWVAALSVRWLEQQRALGEALGEDGARRQTHAAQLAPASAPALRPPTPEERDADVPSALQTQPPPTLPHLRTGDALPELQTPLPSTPLGLGLLTGDALPELQAAPPSTPLGPAAGVEVSHISSQRAPPCPGGIESYNPASLPQTPDGVLYLETGGPLPPGIGRTQSAERSHGSGHDSVLATGDALPEDILRDLDALASNRPGVGLGRALTRLATADSHDAQVWEDEEQQAVNVILQLGERQRKAAIPELPETVMRRMLEHRGYGMPDGDVQRLGKGAYGRVTRICKGPRLFALKRQLLGNADSGWCVLPAVLRETQILSFLRGAPHIVQICDAFLERPPDVHGASGAEVWVVLEQFPHSLAAVAHRLRREASARDVVFQILSGLRTLHWADIVHRDLKPDNVLVDLGPESPGSRPRVAICDFGLSRRIHSVPESLERSSQGNVLSRIVSTNVGTCWWRAPEMEKGWADARIMYRQDLKSMDVFALGLLWAGLLGGRSIVSAVDGGTDPPKLRLLEILKKVDQPSDEELLALGFADDVQALARAALGRDGSLAPGDLAAALSDGSWDEAAVLRWLRGEGGHPEAGSAEQWARRAGCDIAALLSAPDRIGAWVHRHAAAADHLSEDSPAPALIERASRFSYKLRPTVDEVLGDDYFSDLRSEEPEAEKWLPDASHAAPQFEDVRAALEAEFRRQRLAKSQGAPAEARASVKSAHTMIRRELGRVHVAARARDDEPPSAAGAAPRPKPRCTGPQRW